MPPPRVHRVTGHAATGGNLQCYSLLVIDDPQKKRALGVAHAPLAIAVLADHYGIRRWFEVFGVDLDQARIADPRQLFLGIWDGIIVLQSIVTAAESLGLGTCYYGAILSADIQELFDAPEYVFPAGLVAIGWPDEEPELSIRLPNEAVVYHDSYPRFSDEKIRELYRERNAVWDGLPPERRTQLQEKGIENITQGVAWRKYGDDFHQRFTPGLLRNLKRSGFRLTE